MELQLLSFPLVFTAIIFLFTLKKLIRKSANQTPNLPPGPKKLPIIGNLHQLVGPPPHHRLRDLAKEYGSIMHIVISSAEAAKEVTKTHDISFASRPFLLAASIIMYNYSDVGFSPCGDSWRMMRKIFTLELLSAKRVQSFRSIREEEVSKLAEEISACAGSPFNFSKKLIDLTYMIIARASFGKKCDDQDAFIPRAEEITRLFSGFYLGDLFPSVKLYAVLSGMRAKLENLSWEADKIIENIIHHHKSDREDSSNSGGSECILDVLLRVQDDPETPLTQENTKAFIMDMFIAGGGTTSTTTEWAISELIKNPRAMEKAQAEVRNVYDKKKTVDESQLHELKYLKLVIKEALRLYSYEICFNITVIKN